MQSILVACALLASGCWRVEQHAETSIPDTHPLAAEDMKDGWVRIDNMTIAKFDENGKAVELSGIIMPAARDSEVADIIIKERIARYWERQKLERDESK